MISAKLLCILDKASAGYVVFLCFASYFHVTLCMCSFLLWLLVAERVPEKWFLGATRVSRKMFLRQVEQGFSSFLPNYLVYIGWFFKFPSASSTLHFEKSSNMAKNEVKPCSNCLKPISTWHCGHPKPGFWVPIPPLVVVPKESVPSYANLSDRASLCVFDISIKNWWKIFFMWFSSPPLSKE